MLQLRFVNLDRDPVSFAKPKMILGRDGHNDVVIDTPGVASFHAEFRVTPQGLRLTPLNRNKPVLVNGVLLTDPAVVQVGDRLTVGQVEMEIVADGGEKQTGPRPRAPAKSAHVESSGALLNPWTLKGVGGGTEGLVFPLKGRMVVGRDPSCDILMPVREISRMHAEISVEGGQVRLKDLDSANGTFVNGGQVREALLEAGDEVRFDQSSFRLLGPGGPGNETRVRKSIPGSTPSPLSSPTRSDAGARAAVQAPPLRARILGQSGGFAGQTLNLVGEENSIGYGTDNDLVIGHETVSTRHALLRRSGGNWELTDLRSTNGTLVNGERITGSRPIKSQDLVQFGQARFLFDDPDQPHGQTRPFAALGRPRKFWLLAGLLALALILALLSFLFLRNPDILKTVSSPLPITAQITETPLMARGFSDIPGGFAQPVIADITGDGRPDLVVPAGAGMLLALDGTSGEVLFQAHLSGRLLAPPALGDVNGDGRIDVIVATYSGEISAFGGNGERFWRVGPGPEYGGVVNAPVVYPAMGGGRRVAVAVPGGIAVLAAGSGKEIWRHADPALGEVVAGPVWGWFTGSGAPNLLVVTASGRIVAVSDGGRQATPLWEAQLPAITYATALFMPVEHLIVVATDREGVATMLADKGELLWRGGMETPFIAAPVQIDSDGDHIPELALVTREGEVRLVKPSSGQLIKSTRLGTPVEAAPALFDATMDGRLDLVVADMAGQVRVVDPLEGTIHFQHTFEKSGGFRVAAALDDFNRDERVDLVVAGDSGHLEVITLNRPPPSAISPTPKPAAGASPS